jgi:hypothetical protein
MTSATIKPPTSTGRRRAEGHSLIVFASVRLVVMGCFNPIYGIAAIANSHVFTANAHYVFGSLRTWGWITPAMRTVAGRIAALQHGQQVRPAAPGTVASQAMLATLVAAMAALSLIATGRHALTSRHPQLRAHAAAH